MVNMENKKYEEDEIDERYEDSAEYSDWQDYLSMHCWGVNYDMEMNVYEQ